MPRVVLDYEYEKAEVMPYKIITVPFDREKSCFLEEGLNAFCLNKTVVSHKPEFFQDGSGSYWTIFLEYEPVLETGAVEKDKLTDEQQLLSSD